MYIKKKKKTDDLVLSHHGIKGQKWGIRRFQNKDGTRTAAGKARESQRKGYTVTDMPAPRIKGLSTLANTINKRLFTEIDEDDYSDKAYKRQEKIIKDETQKVTHEIYRATKNLNIRESCMKKVSLSVDASVYDAARIIGVNNKNGDLLVFSNPYAAESSGAKRRLRNDYSLSYDPNELDAIYGVKAGTVDYYIWGKKMDADEHATLGHSDYLLPNIRIKR